VGRLSRVMVAAAVVVVAAAGVAGVIGQRHDDARDAVLDELQVPETWQHASEDVRDSGILVGCYLYVGDARPCASAVETYILPEVPSDVSVLTELLPDAEWTYETEACETERVNRSGQFTACEASTVVDGFVVAARVKADSSLDGEVFDPWVLLRVKPE